MRILVINASPRERGNTQQLAEAFVRGAEEVGNEVLFTNLRDKKIAGCLGCRYCVSHEGKCIQRDDMQPILKALDAVDMVVFASPIYWFDMNAQMKTVIDRMFAKAATGFAFNKVALILDADGEQVFDAAVAQYRLTCNYLNWKNMGIILAPSMEKLGGASQSPALKEAYDLGKSLR